MNRSALVALLSTLAGDANTGNPNTIFATNLRQKQPRTGLQPSSYTKKGPGRRHLQGKGKRKAARSPA